MDPLTSGLVPPPRIVEGERRVITILFCDVVSSTSLAGQLDPEEWAEVMNVAFQYMIAPIQEYEGMVARLMGDAVLAFFGAPQAHEDDPQRAVLAGLNIISTMRPFIRQFHADYGLEFNVRVGINTGPVVVGEIGSNQLQEYTAMGDAINLAARMEQTALPGTVQISEDTYRLVAPLFDVWDLGGVEVKGKDEPVHAYRVLGVDPRPGRLRGIEGLETKLIGRTREMSRLTESLTGLASGHSRIVFVLGEAGLGKSRLVAELRREWRARLSELYGQKPPVWSGWTEFVAVSYGASRPYDMLKRQLRHYCGIRETDLPSVIHERLNVLLTLYPPELQDRLHRFFGFLLGDTMPESGPLPEGEAFKRELRAVLTEAAAYQSNQGPIVYVMDDLHWADPASIDALRDLLTLVTSRPILFVLALRPDWNSPGWQLFINTQLEFPEQCVSIFLEPLSREDSRGLITELLGGPIAPARIVDAIQQKAEGNPLFIEEVARALYDNGVVVHTDTGTAWHTDAIESEVLKLISLPGNVQALMTARIDRLAPDVRRALQLASVIGRSFALRVLEQLADPSANVPEQLQALISADLIRPTDSSEGEYAFLHALAREAAYETILLRQRRRYHHQVAEVIEAVYPDRLEEETPRLAYHYAEARDWPRAIHCYAVAGEAAAKIFAHAEAIEHFSRAIELAMAAPAAVTEDELIQLFLRRGRIYELEGHYDDALRNYEMLERLGQQRGDLALELAGVAPQATIFVTPNFLRDAGRGAERAERTLELAHLVGSKSAEGHANWSLLLLNMNLLLDMPHAIEYGERALALARESNLRELEAYVLNDIGRAYGIDGQVDVAIATFAKARALWEELGNDHMLSDSLAISAQSAMFIGDLGDAVDFARRGLALAHRIGNPWGEAQNSYALGYALLELGQIEEACELLGQALTAAERASFQDLGDRVPFVLLWSFWELGAPEKYREQFVRWLDQTAADAEKQPIVALGQGLLNFVDGQPQQALTQIQDASLSPDDIANGPDRFYGWMMAMEIRLANEQFVEVLEQVRHVIYALDELGFVALRAHALYYQAMAEYGLGESEAGQANLRKSAMAMRERGIRHRLWLVLAILARYETDTAQKTSERAEAAAEIHAVADGLNDPALRAAFLELPLVHDILDKGVS